jgi:hypothetical protein
MHIEEISPKGIVTLQVFDANGNLKQTVVENLVVSTGRAYIASRMKDATAAVVSHMAVGTGAVAAAAANTTLGTEAARVAVSATTIVTTTVANDSISYSATFPAGTGTAALTEAGLFNAASVGTLVARTVFGVVTKTVDDSLVITWKIIIA